MGEPAVESHFNLPEDGGPTGFKYLGHLLLAQPPAPSAEKPSVRECKMVFPYSPRKLFNFDATSWTLRTPWSVEEIQRYAPQWHKCKRSDTQGVVRRSPPSARGADGFAAGLGP